MSTSRLFSGYFENLYKRWHDEAITESPVMRILIAGRLLAPLGLLLACLAIGMLLILIMIVFEVDKYLIGFFLLVVCWMAITSVFIGGTRLHSQLLNPLAKLEQTVADVCDGVSAPQQTAEISGVLGELAEDIGSISGELEEVYQDMDDRVARSAQRLHKQTTSLKLLYDVAATVNEAGDVEKTLVHFMNVLSSMLDAKAATVCMVMPEGDTRLVGSMGVADTHFDSVQLHPRSLNIDFPSFDTNKTNGVNLRCRLIDDEIQDGLYEVVEIPLIYHDEYLGHYHLKTVSRGWAEQEELIDLFSSIGHHLGMAIAKQRSDEEARRLSIMEERSAMAHELHDSLAQTIASLRFQVRMLQDSLMSIDIGPNVGSDLFRLKNGIDEAHTELRDLLNSFMAPMDQRGLNTALENVAQRFRQEMGIPVFFQKSYEEPALSAMDEMQVVRIVQESLVNIKKHAKAHTVRILLICRDKRAFNILIEDDGVGISKVMKDGSPGEHIGLTIMEERAKRFGGVLKIESEPGEGTRVELSYDSR